MPKKISSIIDAFKKRGLLILHDDFVTSGRGVLVAAAENIEADRVNEAITIARGICMVAISSSRAGEFMLSRMQRPQKSIANNSEVGSALNMCVSVEAREGVTTGISSADRAVTIRVLGEANPLPRKLIHPGHIFPVEVRDGGVLVKNSLPEGALDAVKIAQYTDAALFIDLLDAKGELLEPVAQLKAAEEHQIPFLTLSQLVQYRLQKESLVSRIADAKLPTVNGGELRSIIYKSLIGDGEHIALVKGSPRNDPSATLVRVQVESTFSDVFGGSNPPSREQIHAALQMIRDASSGVLLYLRQSSHGSLREQIERQDGNVPSKSGSIMREYGLGAQILRDLGVTKAIIISNSATPIVGLDSFGIEVTEYRPVTINSPQTKEHR